MICGFKAAVRQRPQQQRGQAMIEYAIILILLVTLVLGGVELGIAAYSSSKISDAAKAGAQEFAAFNAQNIGREAELKTDLTSLEYELVQLELQKSQLEAERATLESELATREFKLALLEAELDNLIAAGAPPQDIADKQAEINVIQAEIYTPGTLEPPTPPTGISVDIAENQANIGSLGTLEPPTPPTGIYLQIADKQAEIEDKRAEITSPEPSSVTPGSLGDHDPRSNIYITMPACLEDNNYDDGLPDRYVDPIDYPEVANIDDDPMGDAHIANDQIFLFNPLPIDFANCSGNDDTRGGRSRVSILVNGYKVAASNPDKTLNLPGLPKLNQAMFSQYSRVCIENGVYKDCNEAAAPAPILKPPGKLCLSDAPGAEGCPMEINDPGAPIAGYYFFGRDITLENAVFRPTFQIVCDGDGTGFMSSEIMVNCNSPTAPTSVTVHTRYRSIFESFLTFGLYKLPDNTLLPYFYNPGGVNADGGRLNAAVGGEIGTASREGGEMRNTVKKFRDFRGCYSVNTTTNQVSACN